MTDSAETRAGEARRIIDHGPTDFAAVEDLVPRLYDDGRFDLSAGVLIEVGRRAIYDGWEREHHRELAELLRDNDQFSYARRLFRRLSEADGKDVKLRQQHALCTYKDRELPATRRLDRALEILQAEEPLEESTNGETLGLAGAVYKRKWQAEGKLADLESAYRAYLRGYDRPDEADPKYDDEREYDGINAAFVLDLLAGAAERDTSGGGPQAKQLRDEASAIRANLVEALRAKRAEGRENEWDPATLAEALFGLERFDEATLELETVRAKQTGWKRETTAAQLGEIARLRRFGTEHGHEHADGFAHSDAGVALRTLVGESDAAVRQAYIGTVGLALSGGGFRASLFHIGVLARLAERDVLRRVEVLSCVSGGSIVGAFYYLKLRKLLQSTAETDIKPAHYVGLVEKLCDQFLDCVRQNLRVRLTADAGDNWKMMGSSDYSRSDRVAELLDELMFSAFAKDENPSGPLLMSDLFVNPPGRERGFSPRYENWERVAKVPTLVLNATTLNTGHNWQFTASWMGEPPDSGDEQVDANERLRRMYYRDAPPAYRGARAPRLAQAVAASACVPALFPPIRLTDLYANLDVELVDGGVHDNQGVASLLEQDCSTIIVSDASGQMGDADAPGRLALPVVRRTNSVLMSRVRGAQYADLAGRRRAGSLRRLVIVHLKKRLTVAPRDWDACPEPYVPRDEERPAGEKTAAEAYGICEEVQRALAELRTDLDAFTEVEAYSLMAAGYQMAKYELERGLGDFPPADASLDNAKNWPFREYIAQLGRPLDETSLGIDLPAGKSLFFKSWRRWRRRRARGRGAAVAATLAPVPRAGGWVARKLGQPVRRVLTAPLAVAGSAITSAYLRTFGRVPRRDDS